MCKITLYISYNEIFRPCKIPAESITLCNHYCGGANGHRMFDVHQITTFLL